MAQHTFQTPLRASSVGVRERNLFPLKMQLTPPPTRVQCSCHQEVGDPPARRGKSSWDLESGGGPCLYPWNPLCVSPFYFSFELVLTLPTERVWIIMFTDLPVTF